MLVFEIYYHVMVGLFLIALSGCIACLYNISKTKFKFTKQDVINLMYEIAEAKRTM